MYLGDALECQQVAVRSFKVCGCGAAFTRAEWAALELQGMQQLEADGLDAACTIEIRLCSECSSSLAVEVTDA